MILFGSNDTGTYLDGSLGWHNTYRVVELAVSHGMVLDEADLHVLSQYKLGEVQDTDILDEVDDLADKAVEHLESVTDDDVIWERDAGELILWDKAEFYAREWDMEAAMIQAFADHHGGWDFDESEVEDAFVAETREHDLDSWYYDEFLPDFREEDFAKLEELAQSLGLMINRDCVDTIAVEQDYNLVDGFVFRNDY